jgi:hypothetical protein
LAVDGGGGFAAGVRGEAGAPGRDGDDCGGGGDGDGDAGWVRGATVMTGYTAEMRFKLM